MGRRVMSFSTSTDPPTPPQRMGGTVRCLTSGTSRRLMGLERETKWRVMEGKDT